MAENKPYNYESAYQESDVLRKKASMLHGEKATYSQEEYQEAEEHLEELKREFGSLEAVTLYLDLEDRLDRLGIAKEAFAVINENMAEFADIMFQGFNGLVKIIQLNQGDKEKFVGAYFDIGQELAIKLFKLLAEKLTRFQELIKDPATEAEIDTTMCTFSELMMKTHLNPAGIPPDQGPDEDILTPNVHQEPRDRVKLLQKTASPDKGPPPPRKPDYLTVEPVNLEDIEWSNGDSIHFEPVITLKDDQGRERKFYRAIFRFKPEGETEFRTIDLSSYIKGQNVLFEGTEGSITGANLSPEERRRHAGWAVDRYFSKIPNTHLVALKLSCMKEGPKSMNVVFHELGHVFLFGEQHKILGDDQKGLIKKIKALFSKPQPEIRGLNLYRAEVDRLREIITQGLKPLYEKRSEFLRSLASRPRLYRSARVYPRETLAILNQFGVTKFNDRGELEVPVLSKEEFDLIKAIQTPISQYSVIFRRRASDSQFYQIGQNISDFETLVSIFQERNASAFGIKELRRLKVRTGKSGKYFLDWQLDYMFDLAEKSNDPRFVTGPSKKK